jgi:hypothetical protein
MGSCCHGSLFITTSIAKEPLIGASMLCAAKGVDAFSTVAGHNPMATVQQGKRDEVGSRRIRQQIMQNMFHE